MFAVYFKGHEFELIKKGKNPVVIGRIFVLYLLHLTMAATIGIYKIASPTGRIYIGQSVNIENRLRSYRNLTNCKQQPRLYASLLKHGPHNHVFEVVAVCKEGKLNELERFYQEKYETVGKKGLNCLLQKTQDRSGRLCETTKKRMAKAQTGRKQTEQTKQKKSAALLGVRLTEDKRRARLALGLKQSTETRAKIAKAHTGMPRSAESISKQSRTQTGQPTFRSRLVLNSQTGVFYEGLTFAADSANLKRTTLSARLKGVLKNNTDFIFV